MTALADRFRAAGLRLFEAAAAHNNDNLLRLLRGAPAGAALVDLGCDDGEWTVRFAEAAGAASVHGVEIVEERVAAARERGIEVARADLNAPLPYADSSFDVVCSNQVIEHLGDTDTFVREIFRILRPGGYAVTSTENLASWHNVVALALGWQPFSLANASQSGLGLGNPLALHRDRAAARKSWEHLRVFAFRGLRELFARHGFHVEAVAAAGYYPLPTRVAARDPRHAAFLTLKARRPPAAA